MSIQAEISRIKTAIESAYAKLKSKGATLPATLTVENLADCADTIFPAFYSYTNGSGGQYLTFNQVPFAPDLVSLMIVWGINSSSMVNGSVYSAWYTSEHNRYRERISSTNTPQERDNAVTLTNTADENGTYTVSVYCNGSTFPSGMQYMCFLGKKGD